MSHVRVPVLVAVGVLLGLSCKSEPTEPLVPSSLTTNETALSFDALTETAQLSATVLDQNGETMSGQPIGWSSTNGNVATVDESGIVRAVGNGTATIRAAAGTVGANVTVTVLQVVTSLERVTGHEQTGTVATALPVAPTVLGKDRLGNNLTSGATGQTVTFTVTGGGGSVGAATAAFGPTGQALTTWTLGNAPGPNTLSASAGGTAVDFSATGELGPPTTVTKEAGDAQSAEVGTAVATAPRVRVLDVGGNALANVDVTFAITDGLDGSLTGAAVQTDASGFAEVGSWTLATAAGDNTLEAQAATATAVFDATGTAGAAADISILEGNNQSATMGTAVAVAPAVLVADQYDNPVAGEMVDYAVVLGGGSVTGTPATSDADGIARVGSWTMGASTGPNTLDATLTGVGTVTFTATAVPPFPDSVDAYEGDNQTGLVGFAVNIPPAVIVLNAAGDPFQGATVVFAVASGGGSVTGETVISGADGIARVGSWVLGGSAGTNTLTATVQSTMPVTDNPVTFTATGATAAYNLQLQFINGTTPTTAQQQALDAAEAFWETVIYRDVADLTLTVPADACVAGQPALNSQTVDDILVFVDFASIDGPGGILAQAGHCDNPTQPLRSSTDSLPVLGILIMDSADLPGMEANGTLMRVVLHELGHVVGFNRGIFALKEFLQNPSFPGNAGVDTHFDGAEAVAAMDATGGSGYSGAKVPLDNSGQQGQADSHWRESVFDTELMTPFVESGAMPFSRVTAAAMLDLRYGVNLAAAEAFSLSPPAGVSFGPGVRVSLGQDVIFVDLSGTGASARVVR